MSELYALTFKKEVSLKKLGYKYILQVGLFFEKKCQITYLSKSVKALNVMPQLDPRNFLVVE